MGDNRETVTLVALPHARIPQSDLKNVQWGNLLTIVGVATTLGSAIPVGYNIGVINSPSNFIREWCNITILNNYGYEMDYAGLNILWSAIVSVFLIGGAIGSLGGAWMADRFGRKGCFLISGLLFVIGAVFLQFCRLANSVEMLMVGRIIVGLASGLTTATLPIYHTELAPLPLRGTLGVFCSMGVTGGVVVGQIMSLKDIFGSESLWEYALSAYIILVVICYLPAYYYPESPKYLYIIRGETEKARRTLQKLRGNNNDLITKELEEMEKQMASNVEIRSLWSVLKDPTLLLPIVIVCAFQGGQQLSGVNAVFYYSVSIFQQAGLSKSDSEWANLGAGCLNLLTAFFSPVLMAKVNRRPLMMSSCVGSAIALFALTFVVYYIELATWLPFTCIACIFIYIFFYQIGIGPIPYFIGSEIVELGPRPATMSLGSLSSWLCNFLIGMLFPTLQSSWGAFVFLPFSITCALLFILTKLYVPESRGRDSSEIAPLISNGFRSRIVS